MSGTYEVIAESPRLLFVRIVGALSIPEARSLAREIGDHVNRVGEPIYVLGDMSEIQVMNPSARVPLIEIMRNPRLLAGAFYGAPLFAQLGIKAVALAAGALDRIHFFPTEAAARAWLAEQP